MLQPQPDYAKYPVYTGVIGDVPIRMRLGRKPGEIDSVHGEYVAGQQPGVRLVTGEYENGGFLMEESDDGTHVTGTWEGRSMRMASCAARGPMWPTTATRCRLCSAPSPWW